MLACQDCCPTNKETLLGKEREREKGKKGSQIPERLNSHHIHKEAHVLNFNPPPGIIGITDQVNAVLNEMPADVKQLLSQHRSDEVLMNLSEFFQQLIPMLLPIMGPTARQWLRTVTTEIVRDQAISCLLQNSLNREKFAALREEDSEEIDDAKATALSEYMSEWDDKFEHAFKPLDSFKL